ncbi:MAG: hypothetical protein ACI4F5_04130 [Acutalibacteraceae bacterium]
MDIKKVLIALIALVVVGASMGFGYFIAKHPAQKEDNTTASSGSQTTEYENKTSDASSASSEVSSQKTDESQSQNNEQSSSSASLLLGEWTDNANFSGYEFFDNGTMKVTYFNMEMINLDDVIEGTYNGTYSVDGDRLTVSYTIYSKAITKNYIYKVDENTLTLRGDGEEAIYVRKGASTVMENVDPKLLGKWSSNLSGFEFKENGVVAITYIDLGSMGINLPINGTVDGIYTVKGDEITIKYSIYTGVIEKTYKYSIEKDTLTLTEKGTNETGVYTRKN